MVRIPFGKCSLLTLCVILVFGLAACAGSGGTVLTGEVPENPEEPQPPEEPQLPEDPECAGDSYEGTFDAVEQIVFDRYGCRNQGCHGQGSSAGGLDLSPGNAWANLHDVDSMISADKRILPGGASRSVLYQKLAAATLHDDVAGAAMPVGSAALSENDLNLVRWWIYGGAPEEGVVVDAAPYVDGCLPDPEPLTIKPLEKPAASEGIQLVMPTFDLAPGLEIERCFASYFDICADVPDEMKTTNPGLPGVDFFIFDTRELRMDPGSHHLIVNYSLLDPAQLDHEDFGDFRCKGGAMHGELCPPTDLDSCGANGLCASDFREGFTCGGFGPSVPGAARSYFAIGGAQRAQDYRKSPAGVYNSIPCRGVLLWNPHVFNLTAIPQRPQARLNYYFADPDNLQYNSNSIFDTSRIFVADNAPFTRETYCHDYVLPQGTRLYEITSHTHRHGERFWVNDPDGNLMFENFIYNDPETLIFEPALEFDSADPATRTLHYCATYNNGLTDDDEWDIDLVTRASRVPESARVPGSFGTCEPVACVAGNIGAACDDGIAGNLVGDDAACDSSPGDGDGFCDACHITGGESTENEMLLLLGAFYVVEVGDTD
jgi:hypothetical protein